MKIPESPPPKNDILMKLIDHEDNSRVLKILTSNIGMTDTKGRYVHWEKLKHLTPPENLSSEEYWFSVKTARQTSIQAIAF